MTIAGLSPLAIARMLAIVAVLGYLALVALLYVSQRSLIYPVHVFPAEAADRPAPPGLAVVEVATADGERLRALWKPPQDGAPVVVSFHGNAATPHPYADRFANRDPWDDAGAGVLAVAYRGYPGSTGAPTEEGLLDDARAAIAFVRERTEAPLVLHGHSLGAAVAIAVSTETEAALLYLEAPFLSATRMASDLYPWAPVFLLKDDFRSDLRLPRTRAAAVLVAHGDRDGIVPVEQGEGLARLHPAARFVRVPGADHGSILGAADGTAAEMAAAR